jgi:hypothetical protein
MTWKPSPGVAVDEVGAWPLRSARSMRVSSERPRLHRFSVMDADGGTTAISTEVAAADPNGLARSLASVQSPLQAVSVERVRFPPACVAGQEEASREGMIR